MAATTEASSEKSQRTKKGTIEMNSTVVTTNAAIATPDLVVVDGQITTTSLQIAEHFGKRHKNVMKAIANLECSTEFNGLNFQPVEYLDAKGEKRPCYRITRDGFVFLAMGFTGKEAAQWKEAYITAFNKMEQELLAKTTRPHNPALDYDRISPAQAQDLKEIVAAIVQAGIQGYGETWARFQRKFKVNSYLELPATQHLEARAYLLAKLPKAGADNVVDEKPPLATDNEKIKRAFAMASEVAQQAAVTVFNALIDDGDVHKHSRWMFSLSHNRLTNEQDVPWAKPIEHDQMLFSMKDLPRRIVEPNSMIGTREELANIAIACMQKLSGVGEMKMRQA